MVMEDDNALDAREQHSVMTGVDAGDANDVDDASELDRSADAARELAGSIVDATAQGSDALDTREADTSDAGIVWESGEVSTQYDYDEKQLVTRSFSRRYTRFVYLYR